MKVIKYTKFPKDLIDEAKVPIFCTSKYANYLREEKSQNVFWFGGFKDGIILYLIPFSIVKKSIFKKGCFLTAVVNVAPQEENCRKEFLEGVLNVIIKSKLCDWIQQPPNWALFKTVPSDSTYCEFGTYRIDLENKTQIEIFDNFDKVTKRRIKKAVNEKIIVKKGSENCKDYFKVLSETAARGNIKYPDKVEIEKLLEHFNDNLMIYTAYYNNVPQSCAILIFNKYCAYGLYYGTVRKPLHGSNYLMIWQAIKDAKQRGLKYFDFVGARIKPAPGSKFEGIQLFKKHFGVEFVNGFLWKMPISKSKYLFYNIGRKVISPIRSKKLKGDIIDQELKRDKMKDIILTIDYELFLGKETGSVRDCMIEPTNKLISFLGKNNSKMTVFWDILHYFRLLQLENDFPELKEDKVLIKKQILELAEKGHDIQLHLHPHWLDAQYERGKWIFKYDRFSLHNLSSDNRKENINTIIGCVSIAKDLIENLIRKTIPNYKVIAYRAGGYLIEPFNKISNALLENDIFIDSSICPDFSNDNEMFSFNFQNYPTKKYYKTNSSLKEPDDNGQFIEIPISTVKIPIIRNLYFTIIRRLKYAHLENARKGIGSGYSINSKKESSFSKLLRIITQPRINQFTTDSNFKERFNYIFKKVPDKSTMILHPKLLNKHTLSLIKEYIDLGKIKFLSISDFVESMDKSTINKKEAVGIY